MDHQKEPNQESSIWIQCSNLRRIIPFFMHSTYSFSMRLLIGTNNEGKFIEISEVLGDLDFDLLMPKDVNISADPDETGKTFEENAKQKAQFYHKEGKLPTVADDSGIIIEALQDELGIHTRRWGAGSTASDEEWIDHFLKRMKNEPNKRAHFVCSLAYIDPEGTLNAFEGRCSGVITDELEADYLPGLPISACFKPDGYDAVFSALSIEQKNSSSHRGLATHLLRKFLTQSE